MHLIRTGAGCCAKSTRSSRCCGERGYEGACRRTLCTSSRSLVRRERRRSAPSPSESRAAARRAAFLLIARSAAWITKKMQRCRRAAEQCHGWRKPSFCPVPRRTHYLPQGPLKQELQGVALHRTRRIDGVKVAGSPLLGAVLALRTATLPSAAAAARSRPVRRLLGVPDRGNGVSTCRPASRHADGGCTLSRFEQI